MAHPPVGGGPAAPPRRTGGGVADYFAVLGIGPSPVPKYRQKRNPVTGSVSTWGTDEEEECALVERFYREIVEVAVVDTTEAAVVTDEKEVGGERAVVGEEGRGEGGMASGDDDGGRTAGHSALVTAAEGGVTQRGQQLGQRPLQTMPISPVHSDATSAVTCVDRPLGSGGAGSSSRNVHATSASGGENGGEAASGERERRPERVGGYAIVWETMPMGGNKAPNHHGHYGHHNDSTLNDTTISVDASFLQGGKAERHDADMNPLSGLRRSVVDTAAGGKAAEDEAARDWPGAAAEASSGGRGENSKPKVLRGLGQRVGSIAKFRGQRGARPPGGVQEQHTIRGKEAVTDPSPVKSFGGRGVGDASSKRRTFHLGYRRRGADETDLPAVADVAVRYVRVHRATVIPTAAVDAKKAAKDDENEDAKDDRGDGAAQPGEPTGARGAATDALKRGLAAAARRVASEIRDRRATTVTAASPQRGGAPASTSRGAGEDGLRTAGGGSPKLTRRHFFPEAEADAAPDGKGEGPPTTAGASSEGSATAAPGQTFRLEDVLDPPDGYGEWAIPEAYRTLRLPSAGARRRPGAGPNVHGASAAAASPFDAAEQRFGEAAAVDDDARARRRMRRTFLFPHEQGSGGVGMGGSGGSGGSGGNGDADVTPSSEASGVGVEAYFRGVSPASSTASSAQHAATPMAGMAGGGLRGSSSSSGRLTTPWTPASSGGGDRYAVSSLVSPREEDEYASDDDGGGGIEYGGEIDPELLLPLLLPLESLPGAGDGDGAALDDDCDYVPVLAVRRQRVGDEERFLEDPALVEVSVTYINEAGYAAMPGEMEDDDDDDDEEEAGGAVSLLARSKWCPSDSIANLPPPPHATDPAAQQPDGRTPASQLTGAPACLGRHNVPLGFADSPFATSVLDRFPAKDYKGLPLPTEELPMFCYPTGCRLHRAKFQDAPLAQCYGFVVKNERGDSIHVSCVSFMEPLHRAKLEQLNKTSERRRRTSIPHRRFCERRDRRRRAARDLDGGTVSGIGHDLRSVDESTEEISGGGGIGVPSSFDDGDGGDGDDAPRLCDEDDDDDDAFLTGFEEMTTFENKTICLVSRYPFWTAFRRFLSNLHVMSGSSSDLPLERCVSHLLLTVPVPKPGGQCVIVPLHTLRTPMVLEMPPAKDLPLVDLPFQSLFACLDVPTVVTVVLGFLTLERKVIVMSSHPSLVLDVCELLKSLIFPFELCAPYVPRLTQPFMSCLDFPGAIFAGIHDDGAEDGLAAIVRKNMPEESAIVDLDTGEIDCSGDRYEVLKQCWSVIPTEARSQLVNELEALCRDAGIAPGQEPLDSQLDSAFDVSLNTSTTMVEDFDNRGHRAHEPLDDRCIRDCFLRFFCSLLGGYERYLVVPDMDFLISGNEWFNSQGFLAAVPQDRAPFLGSLVTTQQFQSFIERRTEAGDVHCMLFDECLAEFHSSTSIPYGRLGGDVETVTAVEDGKEQVLYSLLVDQSATEIAESSDFHGSDEGGRQRGLNTSDVSEAETNISSGFRGLSLHRNETETTCASTVVLENGFIINSSGDLATAPSRDFLPPNYRFVYCVDGQPCFPHKLDSGLFLPSEPDSLTADLLSESVPILSRSDRELDESNRRRKTAISYRGVQSQRRCLWQLPKLMGSHFLGAWLMCIPQQVAQDISSEHQTRYLLRALGALRLLRSRQRIVPDEAAYRCLMMGLSRAGSDRRVELVKLFGLLRTDGIFPSAVTLGQYTRGIAEGFAKRSSEPADTTTPSAGVIGATTDFDAALNSLDTRLLVLEESGRRWRQRQNKDSGKSQPRGDAAVVKKAQLAPEQKSSSGKTWIPVTCSSSFSPDQLGPLDDSEVNGTIGKDFEFIALWSRATICHSCSYVPLDEEIQSGWDTPEGEVNESEEVCCPRCGTSICPPVLGYRHMSINEALHPEMRDTNREVPMSQLADSPVTSGVDPSGLPPQLGTIRLDYSTGINAGSVPYLSPSAVRRRMERHVEDYGEEVLERQALLSLDSVLFYNFWWYSARFSLPLPLATVRARQASAFGESIDSDPSHFAQHKLKRHCIAFASWERKVAEHGCKSGALAISSFLNSHRDSMAMDDISLTSRFNLQNYAQGDWDQPELSEILVTLVEACDKRDFLPVVESTLRCIRRRNEAFNERNQASGSNLVAETALVTQSEELDCYRIMLYLARYQCTSAFHTFFPATVKPCKGYHFWCATNTPLPIFDRLFRDAVARLPAQGNRGREMLSDVSDIALGFRCIFGQII